MLFSLADDSIEPEILAKASERFLIFYSSLVNGKMWCPDCRDVEDIVQETFSSPESPLGLIVHVGDKDKWKSPSNVYREHPWNIQYIPTIVKFKDGEEQDRLVLDDIKNSEKLKLFIT